MSTVASGKTLTRVTRFAGALVFILGISNLANGATLLGFSPTLASGDIENAPSALLVDGKQYIQMEITDELEYAPNILYVKKDIPVEWEIFGGEFLGCANTLVSPGLGVNTYLKSGMNKVTFTPTKEGKHVFSCSMGMFRGTMIVTS